jgi:colanic acid/amylovoran biosynthesis glycosyltransferase
MNLPTRFGPAICCLIRGSAGRKSPKTPPFRARRGYQRGVEVRAVRRVSQINGCPLSDITLVVISPLRGFQLPSGNIVLTEKFVDGLKLYRELWGGPILHLCAPASGPSDNLDNIEVAMKTPDFDTICAPMSAAFLKAALPKRSIVLASVGEDFNGVAAVCREAGVPCVYVTEYSLRTRTQIAETYQRNALHGAWGKLRQVEQEIRQRRAISMAAGVQCNGLPTFNSYKSLSRSPLLFFDSRFDDETLIPDDRLLAKMRRRTMDDKIRLVFSGRINRMKGADDLPLVASYLREMCIPFEMLICGDGEYLPNLQKDVAARGLTDSVRSAGVLDFKTELVPLVTEFADLFVCCHRQGDPSCTYLETMACGVPIVGYANDAFSALADFSKVGWVTPMSDPLALARTIEQLHRNPQEIDHASRSARSFASKHTFRDSFKRRINHLRSVSGH